MKKKVIMVVDDDYENQVLAQKILEDEYQIASASSGEMALQFIPKIKPQLVLLDLNMPGMSGIEVFRCMKEQFGDSCPPVIFLTADRRPEMEVTCFREGAADYISKPFVPNIMINRVKRTIEFDELQRNLANQVELQTRAIRYQTQKMLKLQEKIVDGLATLIECRDGSTGTHVLNTRRYVSMIAEKLLADGLFPEEVTPEFVKFICEAAPLHDVGKIMISDVILNKPARFTTEEFEIMKTHASEGGKIVEDLFGDDADPEFVKIAIDAIKSHHEKWNGSGYPEGLKEEEIPLAARIMAVADVFDALVSERVYKEAVPVEEAFEIIKASSGSHFDPRIVEVFMALRNRVEEALAEEEKNK